MQINQIQLLNEYYLVQSLSISVHSKYPKTRDTNNMAGNWMGVSELWNYIDGD